MSKTQIPYRIEQTKNRHSRAVYKEETIVIRLAKNLTYAERKQHIDTLHRRMVLHILRRKKRTAIDPFRPLLAGEPACKIILGSGREDVVQLPPTQRKQSNKEVHRQLWKAIGQKYQHEITALVHRINAETFNVHIKNIRMCYYTAQWGSCSSHGTIALNTALLFLPSHLLRYVVIHELAHRKHANHSAHYWKCVESVLPSYKEDRKELRNFTLVTL